MQGQGGRLAQLMENFKTQADDTLSPNLVQLIYASAELCEMVTDRSQSFTSMAGTSYWAAEDEKGSGRSRLRNAVRAGP